MNREQQNRRTKEATENHLFKEAVSQRRLVYPSSLSRHGTGTIKVQTVAVYTRSYLQRGRAYRQLGHPLFERFFPL